VKGKKSIKGEDYGLKCEHAELNSIKDWEKMVSRKAKV